jgi:hypothetical protein
MLQKLWNDETGLILSAELIILLTIGVIALVVGLTSLRDSLVTELADVGQAIGHANQSYVVSGIIAPSARVAGFSFTDQNDFGDTAANNTYQNSRCILISPVDSTFTGSENTQ